jgi:alanyl-tRNA synthetase
LTEELEIDPDEITFIEDVWAGGGNLGPSIEYFVGGLELGNMVFMQFKVSVTAVLRWYFGCITVVL